MTGILGIMSSGVDASTTVNNLQADDIAAGIAAASQPQIIEGTLDLDIRIVRALVTTSGSTQDFTVASFGTPTGVMTLASSDQADGIHVSNTNNYPSMGIGFADGTNEVLTSYRARDGITGTSTSCTLTDAACAGCHRYASAGTEFLSFNSFVTDGVRLNKVSVARDFFLTVILFKGTDFSMACGTTANDSVVSGLSFKPNVLWGSTLGVSSSVPQTTSNIKSNFGLALDTGSGTVERNHAFTHLNSGTPPSSSTSTFLTSSVAKQGSGTGWESNVISWNPDGFELDTVDVSGDKVGYCAMRFGGGVDLETAVSPTATGNDTKTGLSFPPGFLLNVCTDHDTLDTNEFTGTGLALQIAVADGTNEYLHGFCSQDNVSTSNTWTLAAQKISHAYSHSGGTNRYEGSLTVFTADGYTIDYPTTATSPARYQIRLAVEAN